jgi:hypothetical protein
MIDMTNDKNMDSFNILIFVKRNGIMPCDVMRIARKIPMQIPSNLTGVNLHVSNSVFIRSTNLKNGDTMNQKPIMYISFLPSSK